MAQSPNKQTTPQAPPTGLPGSAPFLSILPSGFQIQPVAVHADATPQPGSTKKVTVPQTAIAIVGVTVNVGTGLSLHGDVNLTISTKDGFNVTVITSYTFNRGTKSAYGIWPLNAELQQVSLGVNLQAADTGTFGSTVFFLVGPTRGVPVPTVAFVPDGNPDGSTIVTQTQVSAATTAQTLDTTNTAQQDAIEIIAAWFYAPGGTATGNAGYWDGTQRVDIDTTVAVASYVFNIAKAGPNPTIWNGGQVGTFTFRVVIGAASAGVTNLFVVYRTRLIR